MTMTSTLTSLANPEVTFDASKQTNDSFNQETVILKAQLEDLSCKSQFLDVELKRTSRKLKGTTLIAQGGAEKNKAAQEVIRSLTAQLKDMVKRLPDQSTADTKSS